MEFSFRVLGVHQHLLALLRMTVFGIIFPFCSESSEEMSRFMSHCAVGDQRDMLFGISGAIVGSSSVCHSGINGPFQRTEADVCRNWPREAIQRKVASKIRIHPQVFAYEAPVRTSDLRARRTNA